MSELLWPGLTVLGAYVVLGLTGFGSALLMVPLLAWTWPLPEVVALVLMLDMPASLMHSGLNWRRVQWAELMRLLPGMVLGTLAGLWLTRYLDSRWPLLVLGVYVAIVGLRALRQRTDLQPVDVRWRHLYGMGLGVVQVLFGTAGPVVVAWLTRRLSDPQPIRATIPMIMAVAAVTVLLGMALDGRLSQPSLWQRWTVLIVPALAGVWLGHRLAHRVPVQRLRQMICALLVVSGSVPQTDQCPRSLVGGQGPGADLCVPSPQGASLTRRPAIRPQAKRPAHGIPMRRPERLKQQVAHISRCSPALSPPRIT